jgi:hypothetical protein|tara:strand:- start:791 stop:1084 length:294 start_codon:yes stop_codon:yes gene_type:complete
MDRTCKVCKETKLIDQFGTYRDPYNRVKPNGVCKSCKSHRQKMNRQKYEKSIIIHQSVEADPEELNFEDDPKAKDEIQYGRVSRNPTTLPSNGISYD